MKKEQAVILALLGGGAWMLPNTFVAADQVITPSTEVVAETQESSQTVSEATSEKAPTAEVSKETNIENPTAEVVTADQTSQSEESTSETSTVAEPAADTASENTTATEEVAEVSTEAYEANVSDLTQISSADVQHLLTADGQEHILYIGRPTCYYCRQFSPVLKAFNTLTGGRVLYYNTDADGLDSQARKIFFESLGIPGTPTTLYIKNGQIISGYVGGAESAQSLYDSLFTTTTTTTPEVTAVSDQTAILTTAQETSEVVNVPERQEPPQTQKKTSLLTTIKDGFKKACNYLKKIWQAIF